MDLLGDKERKLTINLLFKEESRRRNFNELKGLFIDEQKDLDSPDRVSP